MSSTILKDIINAFVSIPKGLKVTMYNWSILRDSVTELYPDVMPNLPEAFRGMPTLPVDTATGRSRCIACGACARMCPEDVITVTQDKTDPKDRKPEEFVIDISRCMWCGLCMEVCPVNCLRPARTFEFACRSRGEMVKDLASLMKLGGEFPPEPVKESEPEPAPEN
jgi:formate hydrogenlyase subunit 6/NADH:ubiquinone oxidoreductase subunit I